MPLTKDVFRHLAALQDQDKVLDALDADIAKVPADIAAVREGLESRKGRLNECKTRANTLQLKKKERESQVTQKEEAVKKHSAELNQVKTNEAFRALQNEIDAAKKAIGDLETDILTTMDEMDAAAKDEKAAAAEFKDFENKAQTEVKALEARKAELEARLQAERAKREALVGQVPPEALKVYEHTRKRRAGVALSAVRGNSCSMCKITLPPQFIVDAVKGSKLVLCENCQRILYVPEGATVDAAAHPETPTLNR